LPWQQSHHCGIETLIGHEGELVKLLCSNRTIVGLKQVKAQAPSQSAKGSNRTIVGLKQGVDANSMAVRFRAAIAPLWD